MGDLGLAFQRWERGQVLLPEHFLAEEEAIAAHAALAAALRGLPSYGVGQLAWSAADLERGVVAVSDLTVIFPSGRPLVVRVTPPPSTQPLPSNAGIANLNLADVSPPVREATLYLHLLRGIDDTPLVPRFDTDPETVKRAFFRLVLSVDGERKDALDSLKLCQVAQDGLAGKWALSEAYVPPLVQVGNNPFLRARLQEVSRLCAQIERTLERQLTDPLFRGERSAAARRCQAGATRLQLLLEEYEAEIHLHPYQVFDTVRAFDCELSALSDDRPERVRYRHDDLAGSFDDLLRGLRRKAGGEPVTPPNLPFVQASDDQPYLAAPFGPALLQAAEVYLVVDRVDMERTPLAWLKLAAPGRLDEVIRRSLPGVALRAISSPPPFRHDFGPQVDFYQLDLHCDEWRRALDAGALAYRATAHLTGVRTALFWRTP